MKYPDKLTASLPGTAGKLVELSSLQGQEYLAGVADWLCQELDVFAVSIGELTGSSVDEVRVLGFSSRDGLAGPEVYALAGTPCHSVIDSQHSHCLVSGAWELHPQDALFVEHHIESYVGVSLRDGFGRAFGLICVFDDKPRNDNQNILSLIQWLAARIGNEAGAIRTRNNLANSVRWMAQSRPEEVFVKVTTHLCEVLQVTTSLIMEWPEDFPGEARALTLLHQGDRIVADSDARVSLARTCFAGLEQEDFMVISSSLGHRYPDCAVLGRLGLQSCLAVCIKDRHNRKLGHLAIAHSRGLEQELLQSPVLSLYLARVSAELERMASERERAAIERALGVKHKLESLGLMAGHIAHDFNNLLMAILGNANLAADQLEPDSLGHKYLENIEAAATSAGDVVSQLLDYAGRKPNRVSLLDVSQAVAAASRLVALTRAPDTSVTYDLAESLPLVEVDPAQLQQIVINLVLNAAEALNGNRGEIGISVGIKTLTHRDTQRLMLGRELAPGDYVEVCVSDTGAGIDDSTLARMFDPFFTRKPEGRGLGLAAVRGFVQANDGGLAITTEVGIGTRVSLYLQPAAGNVTPVRSLPLVAESQPLSVLVIDDELLVAQTAMEMLNGLGYQAQMALSCEEALALARRHSFDCALIDVRMPRIDGWTTLRRLRSIHPQIPAVMMTGYSNEARATELVARYQVGLLYKPFEASELVSALAEVTSSVLQS